MSRESIGERSGITLTERGKRAARAGKAFLAVVLITGATAATTETGRDMVKGTTEALVNVFNPDATISASEEKARERCVSALVGRQVDLVPNPGGEPGLQHPASVFAEQSACEDANNDVAQAQIYLGH